MRLTHKGMFLILSFGLLAFAMLGYPSMGFTANSRKTLVPEPPQYYLDQGWTPEIRQAFHFSPQGSELIPYYWFLNLKEPDGTTFLKDDLKKYGVIYDRVTPDTSSLNPDGLPIGFVQQKEDQTLGGITEKHWLGLTCAACHTGAIIPKSGSNARKQGMYIIDGAPANVDFGSFIITLRDSVLATNSDPARLKALAQKVLAAGDGSSIAEIEARFNNYTQGMKKILPLYIPQEPCGPSRLDCLGAIFNRVSVYDIKSQQPAPAKLDAPVSFPFIWYSDRQDKIQWYGELPNANWFDRLARNTGEVCGVFAQVVVKSKPGLKGYPSSVNVLGLGRVDQYVSSLKSPKWTDIFPAPDPVAVSKGRKIYMETCQTSGCHQDLAANGKVAKVNPTPLLWGPDNNPNHLPDLNTDWNNTKLVHDTPSKTGLVEGEPTLVVVGKPLNAPVQAVELVDNVVAGSLLGEKGSVLSAYFEYLIYKLLQGHNGGSKPTLTQKAEKYREALSAVKNSTLSAPKMATGSAARKPGPPSDFDPWTAGYESRSLNGIWATAPYLHNGSVPNLYELLWPEKRNPSFFVGSRVYDPDKVGFVSDGSAGGVKFDTLAPGNSNQGHTYGATLSDEDKGFLLAYLKQL